MNTRSLRIAMLLCSLAAAAGGCGDAEDDKGVTPTLDGGQGGFGGASGVGGGAGVSGAAGTGGAAGTAGAAGAAGTAGAAGAGGAAPVVYPEFGETCTDSSQCGMGECVSFGAGEKSCTVPCTVNEDCPVGSEGQSCNNKGYCRP